MKSATLVEKPSSSSCAPLAAAVALGIAIILTGTHLRAEIDISPADAQRIGRRIWQNECGGKIAGLTSWNAGENFASLGIGHFIWYPKDERGPFEESFPELVRFISARGAKLPELLLRVNRAGVNDPGYNGGCPWNSRAEFLKAHDSTAMKQLRQFLVDTIDLQAQFLVARLENSLPKMLAQTADRQNVQRQFERVGRTAQGCYALVDYVNFKGEGTLSTERYRGQGWGLLQVLETVKNLPAQSALDEFADSAKTVLQRRVANSPPARAEARWLPGWLARVESYRAQP
jgi:hypothetical protein